MGHVANIKRYFALSLALLFAFSAISYADVTQLSETEFRELATELSHKVNLFHDAWIKDPNAEFYGGTSRDFLYWIKGQFKAAHNREEALAIKKRLLATPAIDVKEFLIGDSDVDVVSSSQFALDPKEYGVRKIDTLSSEIFDPKSELGQNERLQGYIPAEKIRLTHGGFSTANELGNGLNEIYTGHLTVAFAKPSDFNKSKYAREGLNHPILLALRYLRLQAMDYFQTYGKDLPAPEKLLKRIDPETDKKLREVFEGAIHNNSLKPNLARYQFVSWINGTLKKMFRSYTNPDVSMELVKAYGIDRLPTIYSEIEPLNQYLFQKARDPIAIEKALKKYGVKSAEFFLPRAEYFPDGYIYHGTRKEDWFRTILFQGVLPSTSGAAGAGLYGVAEKDKEFSERWAGDKQRLIRFPISETAKIVDITQGEGQRVWNLFGQNLDDYEKFADTFGIDILRYPYSPQAFVVKNSQALGTPNGVYRTLLPLSSLIEKLKDESDPIELYRQIEINNLNARDEQLVLKHAPAAAKNLSKLTHSLTGVRKIVGAKNDRLSQQALEILNAEIKSHPGAPDKDRALRASLLSLTVSKDDRALVRFIENDLKDIVMGSAEVDDLVFSVLEKAMGPRAKGHPDPEKVQSSLLSRKWTEPEKAKRFFESIALRTGVDSDSQRTATCAALYAFKNQNPSEAELEHLIQTVPIIKKQTLLADLLRYDPKRATPIEAKALMSIYLRSADNQLYGEKTEIIRLLSESSEKVHDYVRSIMTGVMKQPSPLSQNEMDELYGNSGGHAYASRKVYEILSSSPNLITKNLQEELLDILESLPLEKKMFADNGANTIFKYFDLKDPRTADRIQQLYLDGKVGIGFYRDSNVLDVVKHIPKLRPELRERISENVQTMKYEPHFDADFKTQWAELESRTQNCVLHNLIPALK
jgi:hypothetical protein